MIGVLIGGALTAAVTWWGDRVRWKRDTTQRRLERQPAVYTDLLAAARTAALESTATGDAFTFSARIGQGHPMDIFSAHTADLVALTAAKPVSTVWVPSQSVGRLKRSYVPRRGLSRRTSMLRCRGPTSRTGSWRPWSRTAVALSWCCSSPELR